MVLPGNMNGLDVEDFLTKLNTQLNKSMVLMDNTMEGETYQQKSNKSITINTKLQPPNSPGNNTHNTSRRSILKKPEKTVQDTPPTAEVENIDRLNNTESHRLSVDTSLNFRPHSLQELMQIETLDVEQTSPAFNLDDLSDSEDIWIMDIPRTIDPQDLRGQTLILGDKSKFKIKDERYCAVNHDVKCNVTCVFNTGKVKRRYKTVNVKPAGTITVRRKLSGTSKIKPIQVESTGVPFPKNIKTRHPLFGVSQEGKVKVGAKKHND